MAIPVSTKTHRSTIGRPVMTAAVVVCIGLLAVGAGISRYGRGVLDDALSSEAGDSTRARTIVAARADARTASDRVRAVLRRGQRAAETLAGRARSPGAWWTEPGGWDDYGPVRAIGTSSAALIGGKAGGYALWTGGLGSAASEEQRKDLFQAMDRLEPLAATVLDPEGGVVHAAVSIPGRAVVGAPWWEPRDRAPDGDRGREVLDWFRLHLEENLPGDGAWMGPESDGPLGRPVLTYVLPVPAGAPSPEAVVCIQISLDAVCTALAGSDGEHAAVLLQADGRTVASSPSAADELGATGPEAVPLEDCFRPILGDVEALIVPLEGTALLRGNRAAGLHPVGQTPWSVATLRPMEGPAPEFIAAMARVGKVSGQLATIAVALLALVAASLLMFALLLARALRNRIAPLVEGAAEHAVGNLAHPVPVVGDDELGTIASSLNSTAARLRQSMARSEEGERRLQGLIDNMGEGFLICDGEDHVVFANKRYADLFGKVPEDLYGRYLEELMIPSAVPEYRRHVERRRHGRTTRYEVTWFRPGGNHPTTLVSGMPLYDQEGRYSGSYAVVTDITTRSAAEAHTAKEEKLRALGEMAGAVAHDFNNNLTAILGNAQFLLLDEREEPVKNALEVIEQAALKSYETVRRMREFTRPRSLELGAELVNPNALLNAAVEDVRVRFSAHARQHSLTFRVKVDAGAHRPIRGHEEELREALVNVIANALESMPEGGAVELAVFDRGEDAVAFRVSDQGCGIDFETERKIFDPFFTTKVENGMLGTGLGLSIAYGIVKAHRGRIDLRSEPDKGTTFTLVLPAFSVAEHRGRNPEDSHDGDEPPEPRILIVAPENQRSANLHKRLQEFDIHTVVVHEPASAAGVLTDPGMFNALVVEYDLDGENGWEFARKIRSRRSDICVVLLADASHGLDATQGKNAGIDRIIVRPFDAKDVERAVLSGLVERLPPEQSTIDERKLDTIEVELQERKSEAHRTEIWAPTGVAIAEGTAAGETPATDAHEGDDVVKDVTVDDIFFQVNEDGTVVPAPVETAQAETAGVKQDEETAS